MGLIEFSKLPVNTLVGADWKTFKEMTAGQPIDSGFRTKYYLTKSICRLLSVLTPIQERRYRRLLADKPLQHDPLFILGHWRSGTTFVHNIFAQDHHFGHTTTYQTVFPHLMMFGQPFFKFMMNVFIPNHRPTDGMELTPDTPQEEEFALNNTMPYSYYNFCDAPDKDSSYNWFLDYYLDNMSKAEKTAGKRLIDAIDVHYYSEAKGDARVTEANATSDKDKAARVQAPRTLYEDGYREVSWVTDALSQYMPFIPTIQASIDKYYPGTKLAITEYNFGGGMDSTGAIAEADALGAFAASALCHQSLRQL